MNNIEKTEIILACIIALNFFLIIFFSCVLERKSWRDNILSGRTQVTPRVVNIVADNGVILQEQPRPILPDVVFSDTLPRAQLIC